MACSTIEYRDLRRLSGQGERGVGKVVVVEGCRDRFLRKEFKE